MHLTVDTTKSKRSKTQAILNHAASERNNIVHARTLEQSSIIIMKRNNFERGVCVGENVFRCLLFIRMRARVYLCDIHTHTHSRTQLVFVNLVRLHASGCVLRCVSVSVSAVSV